MKYEEKKFNLVKLEGISEKTISEHLKLYAGYVKHLNLILEKSADLLANPDTQYTGAETHRRLAFEFNGMRNHEIYFGLLENGKNDISTAPTLKSAIEAEWGSVENWLNNFKKIASTRGPGWVMLYKDSVNGKLINGWVDEQHQGLLNGLPVIIALDVWEHAFFLDYSPADKMKYVEAFFANLNWSVAEKNFSSAK